MEQGVSDNSWHLQKGVPIALILAIGTQLAAGVWFASDMSNTIESVATKNVAQDTRLDRVETDTRALQISAATLVEQLAGLRTSLNELKQEQRETNNLLRQLVQPTP